MKILFFLESLHSGGKERRAVELFHYLINEPNIHFEIVLTEKDIHYKYLLELNIKIHIIERNHFRRDPFVFYKFFKIAKAFRPNIIHCWGLMTTFYAIPSAKIFGVPLLNSAIADAFPKSHRSVF